MAGRCQCLRCLRCQYLPVMRRKSVRMTSRENPPTAAVTITNTWPWSDASSESEHQKQERAWRRVGKSQRSRDGKRKTRTVVSCGELELGAVAAVAGCGASSDVEHVRRGRLQPRYDRAGNFSASGRVAQLLLLLIFTQRERTGVQIHALFTEARDYFQHPEAESLFYLPTDF